MPSKARYAAQKAKAAAQGTTPYKVRVASAVRRHGPSTSKAAAAGHAESRAASLAHRVRHQELAHVFNEDLGVWCAVCGSAIESSRPNSYTDRACGTEQMRRWRADGERRAGFEEMQALANDREWVANRRRQSRAAGIPVHPGRRPRISAA